MIDDFRRPQFGLQGFIAAFFDEGLKLVRINMTPHMTPGSTGAELLLRPERNGSAQGQKAGAWAVFAAEHPTTDDLAESADRAFHGEVG